MPGGRLDARTANPADRPGVRRVAALARWLSVVVRLGHPRVLAVEIDGSSEVVVRHPDGSTRSTAGPWRTRSGPILHRLAARRAPARLGARSAAAAQGARRVAGASRCREPFHMAWPRRTP